MSASGQAIKGVVKWIKLLDGSRIKLERDFNTRLCWEREFTLPEQARLNEIAEKLTIKSSDPEKHHEATTDEVLAYCERNGIQLEHGLMETQARWAYALSASYREDNPEHEISWSRFRRLLPHEQDEFDRWKKAVLEVLAARKEDVSDPKFQGEPAESTPSPVSAD